MTTLVLSDLRRDEAVRDSSDSPALMLSSARLRQVLALVQTLNSKPIVGVVPKEKEAAHERS